MMLFIQAVACVATVALVKGEADADAFYGPYGYGLGYAAYGAHPYTYGYAGYPYAYAAPSAYAQVSPSASLTTVGLADASIPAVAGGYAGAGRYVANSAGVVHVAKREAEAEADADAFYGAYGYGLPYAAYGAHHYGYAGYPYAYGAYGYAGYPYTYAAAPAVAAAPAIAAAPAVAAAPAIAVAPAATAQVSPSASLTTVGLADASIPAIAGGYAGAGRYVANSAGVVHVAKREAEAEADADAFYGAYGYGLPYAAYGAHHYGYAGYPYAYGAYGYAGYPYTYAAAPAVAVAPAATAQVSPSASLTTVGLADASIPAIAGGYAGAGRYVANSAGVVHVA